MFVSEQLFLVYFANKGGYPPLWCWEGESGPPTPGGNPIIIFFNHLQTISKYYSDVLNHVNSIIDQFFSTYARVLYIKFNFIWSTWKYSDTFSLLLLLFGIACPGKGCPPQAFRHFRSLTISRQESNISLRQHDQMYLLEPMSAEPVSSLYESACQNYLLLLLQINCVPAWAELEPVYMYALLPFDFVVYPMIH